ncbi:MAG TPA: hypothetical protein VJC09_00330 [Candidatus Saccharimonadales bacterium]|nr:hypothetical protein [Candidatus Saccharimonadales bacterium]
MPEKERRTNFAWPNPDSFGEQNTGPVDEILRNGLRDIYMGHKEGVAFAHPEMSIDEVGVETTLKCLTDVLVDVVVRMDHITTDLANLKDDVEGTDRFD